MNDAKVTDMCTYNVKTIDNELKIEMQIYNDRETISPRQTLAFLSPFIIPITKKNCDSDTLQYT